MQLPPPHQLAHVYHLSLARLLPLPLLWAVLTATLLLLGLSGPASDPNESDAFVFVALVLTLIMLPFFALLWQSRLVLTAEGIAHHQFGYTVRSSWSNLKALSLVPGQQALVLDAPGTRSSLLRWSARILPAMVPISADALVGDTQALAEGRLILLAPFMTHWKRGPLRDDLLHWAPQLFDKTQGH